MFIGHSLMMLQRIIGMPKKFLVIHQNRTNELSSRVDKPATGFWYIEIHRVERNFINFYRIYVFELARFVKIWVPDEASSRKLRNEWNLLELRQLCPPSIWAMIAPSPTRCRQEMDERYVLPWLCRWSCLVISHGSLFSKIRVPLSVLVHLGEYCIPGAINDNPKSERLKLPPVVKFYSTRRPSIPDVDEDNKPGAELLGKRGQWPEIDGSLVGLQNGPETRNIVLERRFSKNFAKGAIPEQNRRDEEGQR